MKFQTVQGQTVDNLAEYIRKWMKREDDEVRHYPTDDFILYVASDSKNSGRHTTYVTVVAIYRVGKGAHVILHKENVKRIGEIKRKLNGEGERTMEIVIELIETLPEHRDKIIARFDFNGETKLPKHEHNPFKKNSDVKDLIHTYVGWCTGLGVSAESKPLSYVAMHCADNYVQKHKKVGEIV